MGFHHCDLHLCIILRLTSIAPAPDKEIRVGCDEQTKKDKCVSHIYSCSSASWEAAGFAVAEEANAAGQVEEAVDQLLELFKRDRDWNDGAAKSQLFTIFEALEPNNIIVLNGRRKLSSLIFA